MSGRRHVSWNQCTTLRTELAEPRAVPDQTPSQRRRRSLHRGALRFVRDVCASGRRYRRVLLFALTMADIDAPAAQGAVREVFHRYRKICPGARYLWWAEFQKRGALHYHGMLIDPPWQHERDARHWFDRWWPLAEIQTWVEYRSAAWFKSSAGAYALKDVRKVGGKTYEQQYELMPPKWKTYSCHHLERTALEHKAHENHSLVGWLPKTRELAVWGMDEHVPARGGCIFEDRSLELRRRRTLRPPRRRSATKVSAALADNRSDGNSAAGSHATGRRAPPGARGRAAAGRPRPRATETR